MDKLLKTLVLQAGLLSKGSDTHIAVLSLDLGTAPKDGRKHTVLLLDCSGSMAGSIADLRQDSARYVDQLGETDYASVIAFSGHGQARMIAGPTLCTTEGRKAVVSAIVDNVRTMGVTVFSEPLALALKAISQITDKDVRHGAVLFTDGVAVPERWSKEQEESKALTLAADLEKKGVVTSVIGYGVHYDETFLHTFVTRAGLTGIYRHISEIDDVSEAIAAADEVLCKTLPVDLEIGIVPDHGKVGLMLKKTPDITSIGDFGHAHLRGVYEGKLTLLLQLLEPATSFTVNIKVNGQRRTLKNVAVAPLSEESRKDFIFTQAAYHYIRGEQQAAEAVLEALRAQGQEGLAAKVASAYSDREGREARDLIRRFYRDRSFIGAGLKPVGPNLNVLNVLRVLIEDKQNVVFIPKGAYKRSGELMVDPRIVPQPHGRTLQVTGYSSHKSRFNFNIKAKKQVMVRPETGDGPAVPMQTWNDYNVILDGNLHLPTLEATLSEESFDTLREAGVIDQKATYSPTKVFTLDLRSIPLTSPVWANPKTLGLAALLREEAELMAEQKALNARRKTLKAGASGDDDEEDLVAGDMYRPQAKKVDDAVVEHYQAPCTELRLMKYKTQTYDVGSFTYEQADARVKEVRHRLLVVRFLARAITFSMEIVGSKAIAWDAGTTTKKGKEEKLERTAVIDGATLKKVTWVETVACS